MSTFAVLLFVLVVPSGAAAQEVALKLGGGPETPWLASPEAATSVSLFARFSAPPGGDVDDVDYDDAFGRGIGWAAEVDYMPVRPGGLALGPYASLGWDRFSGESTATTIGIIPTTIDVDDLQTVTIIVGVKGGQRPPEGLLLDGRVGLGLITYLGTEADVTQGPFTVTQDLIDSDTTFVGEVGGRIGYGTGSFLLQAGLFARVQGGPEGDDLDFKGGAMTHVGGDIGLGIRF